MGAQRCGVILGVPPRTPIWLRPPPYKDFPAPTWAGAGLPLHLLGGQPGPAAVPAGHGDSGSVAPTPKKKIPSHGGINPTKGN